MFTYAKRTVVSFVYDEHRRMLLLCYCHIFLDDIACRALAQGKSLEKRSLSRVKNGKRTPQNILLPCALRWDNRILRIKCQTGANC